MGWVLAARDVPLNMNSTAPIVLFVYNRPWHTQQTVEALQQNKLADQSDLFIFSDGPKRADAIVGVQTVRNYVKTVRGFKTVNIIERPANFGLAKSVVDGVTRLCEEHGRVIVIEDDLVTSPYFLEYMNTALERYETEERVMQVAGYMFPVKLEVEEDALFLPFISSWGWATWRRAWQHFDRRATGHEGLLVDAAVRKQFDLNGHYKYSKMLRAQQQGKVDSWAILWYVSVFLRNGLVLYPKQTLVRNLGFDGSGVNCTVSSLAQEDLNVEFRVNSLPEIIDVSPSADEVMNNIPAPKRSLAAILSRLTGPLRRYW